MSDIKKKLQEKEIMDALLNPYSIGQLKKAIENLDDSLLVFCFEFGNERGHSKWTRNQTYRQWLKELKNEV